MPRTNLESENKQLRFLLSAISCPSPIKGWLPTPIPDEQRPVIDKWLEDKFSCEHHGEGYFEGFRFCLVDAANCDSFPLPLPPGVELMVQFSNSDQDGTTVVDSWYATEFDWKLRLNY